MGPSAFMGGCRRELLPLVRFFVWSLVGCMLALLQIVMHLWNPTKRTRDLSSRHGCVITSRVLLRWKNNLANKSSPEDFLLWTHRQLSSLEILLEKDVSLYCMTPELAVFVRTSPHKNCYRSETSPFFYMAQMFHAEEVYITTHHWLDLLTSEIAKIADNRHVPITWVSNVSRCGSTLLCQIMEGIPGTLCISEPDALFNIHLMTYSRMITQERRLSMLRSAIIILLYHAKTQGQLFQVHTEHIFIKTRAECLLLVRDLFSICPHIRHVFMYRRLVPCLKSRIRLIANNRRPWVRVVNSDTVARITPWFRRYMFRCNFYASEDETASFTELIPTLSFVGMLAAMFCSQVKLVQSLQAEGHSIPALLYEDVVASPVATVGRLFDHLHLSRDHLDVALTAMSRRSQSSVPGFDSSNQVSSYIVSDQEWREVDSISVKYQLPKTDGLHVKFIDNISCGH
ncbi:hypothetical protein ACOMHN_042235 [Nucella lapillus]